MLQEGENTDNNCIYTSDLKQKIFDTCKNICGEELENTYRSNIRTQLCIKVERKYFETAVFF